MRRRRQIFFFGLFCFDVYSSQKIGCSNTVQVVIVLYAKKSLAVIMKIISD